MTDLDAIYLAFSKQNQISAVYTGRKGWQGPPSLPAPSSQGVPAEVQMVTGRGEGHTPQVPPSHSQPILRDTRLWNSKLKLKKRKPFFPQNARYSLLPPGVVAKGMRCFKRGQTYKQGADLAIKHPHASCCWIVEALPWDSSRGTCLIFQSFP